MLMLMLRQTNFLFTLYRILSTNHCKTVFNSNMKRATGEKSHQSTKKTRTLDAFFQSSSKHKCTADTAPLSEKSTLSISSSIKPSPTYKVFCDLDGVLVDFTSGVKKLFNGRRPDDLDQSIMWSAIHRTNEFYAHLPWMPDAKRLWDELKTLPIPPVIITGVPRLKNSRYDKFAWCKRELDMQVNHVDMAGKKNSHTIVSGNRKHGVVNVLTCWSKNKHYESGKNHILIDDRLQLKEEWESRGGIFIHHINADQTLSILKEKGVLLENVLEDLS